MHGICESEAAVASEAGGLETVGAALHCLADHALLHRGDKPTNQVFQECL